MTSEQRVIIGNAMDILKTLPDGSVDCVMTSPPYYGLRSYGEDTAVTWQTQECEHEWTNLGEIPITAVSDKNTLTSTCEGWKEKVAGMCSKGSLCGKCGAWHGCLGMEPDADTYISHLCDIFDEVKRVLKPTGTCFVNIGDSYGGTGNTGETDVDPKNPQGSSTAQKAKKNHRSKSLILVPQRFAIEMSERGWYVRNTIIWHRPAAMPASVKDRFTVDYEYVFFFTKNRDYYFNQILEPVKDKSGKSSGTRTNPEGRNKRCVWSINQSQSFLEHPAMYPIELVETPIKCGCPPNGTVLDPFCGSGTTLEYCRRNDINAIGIEINPEYGKMAKERCLSHYPQLETLCNERTVT